MKLIKLDQQFFFVKFPIIFPILYGIILYNFPKFETQLIIVTILLLAETHFGATWPFLSNKSNYSLIKENRIGLIVIPIIIAFFSITGFFINKNLLLLIFFMANLYHVTRQSFGVCKLYCNDEKEIKYQENLIYIINFVFFIVGLFRFYLNVIDSSNIFFLNLIIVILIISLAIFYLIKFRFSENFLTFLTGCLIFYPICFVNNPIHAIIMGVTMHYTQYIYLTYNVCKLRDESKDVKDYLFSKKISNYLVIIFIYSIIMTILSLFSKFDDNLLKNLIIIPIVGQMLHFYLDSQLWKFSNKYNRENTLLYLKKLIKE